MYSTHITHDLSHLSTPHDKNKILYFSSYTIEISYSILLININEAFLYLMSQFGYDFIKNITFYI